MKKSKPGSRSKKQRKIPFIDYPLQGTKVDLPLETVFSFSADQRNKYVKRLLNSLGREIKHDRMALKARISFAREMRDLRKLLYAPVDKYLYTDQITRRRNVLGKGSPGSTHTYWSRTQMWKMATKGGDLRQLILGKTPNLVTSLERLFDPNFTGKASLRTVRHTAVQNALSYMQFDKGVGTAFPPFHAKFFADKYLPKQGDGIIVDPCAGWGGRLLGSLCVPRSGHVRYYGTDPEKRNKPAYEGLTRRINVWLKREIPGKRTGRIFYQPFEDWMVSKSAKKLRGMVDLVFTSPPYFSAENYNTDNRKQSANRYTSYDEWRELFYRRLVQGAYDLLKPGGHFVLNIANVAEAKHLERDARTLAKEVGFERAAFFKLAMSINPRILSAGPPKHSVTVDGSMFKYEPVFCFMKPL